MPKILVLVPVAMVLPPLALVVTVASAVTGMGAPAAAPATAAGPLEDIPPTMLRLYGKAASTCPGLPWQVLAAIGKVESDHGESNLPGVHGGHNAAGAEGPMQFEPATFAAFDRPSPPGGALPPSPYDPTDAVYAAARMLCADGAGDPATLGQAIWDYNHSATYVATVLAQARSYGWGAGVPSPAGEMAVEFALRQVGTPYVWGGDTPGVGFDCSGLVQAAYASAGIRLPRVAQDQLDAGPPVPDGAALAPGDLVFFGPRPGDATHVGLVVDPAGTMVDAPHAGSAVRVEPFPTQLGGRWGSDMLIGATAPASRLE